MKYAPLIEIMRNELFFCLLCCFCLYGISFKKNGSQSLFSDGWPKKQKDEHIATPKSPIPIHFFVFHSGDKFQLLDWYLYHSRIAGWKQLHGIAHNYNDMSTLYVLRNWGADIVTFNGSFGDKGQILTALMRKFTSSPAYLIPLDLDEFLVAETTSAGEKTFSSEVHLITNAFEKLPPSMGFKYKMYPYMGYYCTNDTSTANISIARRVEHFHRAKRTVCGSKTFYYSKDFIQIDQGNHFGVTRADNSCKKNNILYRENCQRCFHNVTGLGLLHYGDTSSLSYEEYVLKAMKGAAAYNQTPNDDCTTGGGQHYCKFLSERRVFGDEASRLTYEAQKSCHDKQHNTDVKDAIEVMLKRLENQNH